jgi:hypothetical protein
VLDRARTPESKVRVWSQSLNPIDSIGQPLSITVGRNAPGGGMSYTWAEDGYNFEGGITSSVLCGKGNIQMETFLPGYSI